MKYLNQIATLSLIFTVSNNTVLATNSRAFTEYLGGVSNLISKFVQNTAIPTKPEDWMHYNPLSNLTDLLTTIINFNLDSINISSIEKNKIEKCKSYLKCIKQYIDQKPIRNSNEKSFQEKFKLFQNSNKRNFVVKIAYFINNLILDLAKGKDLNKADDTFDQEFQEFANYYINLG